MSNNFLMENRKEEAMQKIKFNYKHIFEKSVNASYIVTALIKRRVGVPNMVERNTFTVLGVRILNLNSVSSLLWGWINIPSLAWEYGTRTVIASSLVPLRREGLAECFSLAITSPNSTYFIMFITVTTCFKVSSNRKSKMMRRNIHPKAKCRIKQYLWDISGNILFFKSSCG